MLQIYTDNLATDLDEDISIDLMYENPLFTADHVPATYSLSYDLPLTTNNRQIFGNPDRITAAGDRFREHPTRILFAGIEIASGVQTIEEIGESITVNFSGSILPENIKKRLQNIEMDIIDLTGYNGSAETAKITWNGMLRTNMNDPEATFFAPPIAIKDVERMERDMDNPEDIFLNTRSMWLNAMYIRGKTYQHFLNTDERFHILKLLPAIRVWYIFDKIFGDKLTRNLFKEGEWKKLSLQSLWHPKYNLTDNEPCWTVSPEIPLPNITISLRDFMPDVLASDFIVELLKLPCASMYIKGDTFNIELNDDILNRNIVRNIRSDQLIGTPTITREAKQKYTMGYASSDEGEQPEGEITNVKTILDGIKHITSYGLSTIGPQIVTSVSVANPPQVLTAILDTTGRTPYAVKQEDMSPESVPEEDIESEESDYDMTANASIVKCVANKYWLDDNDMVEDRTWYDKILCPEIEKIGTKRGDEILLGLCQGMQSEIQQWTNGILNYYPCLSATNYGANGERFGDLSLYWNGKDGLAKRHQRFADWISKDKIVINANVLFTPLELHNLDLRDKFSLLGGRFFIRTMNVSLKKSRIEPAEVEFIET